MYRYLDRAAADVGEPQRFLLSAMRLWVDCARAGRCACAALACGFARRGVASATRDFGMVMAALDRDALVRLHFGHRHATVIGEDEARLLTLFEAALAGDPTRVRRIAAALVRDDAIGPLSTAVEWVALHLSGGTFMEHDQ